MEYVAPHTGAWIETEEMTRIAVNKESHPTRVRGLKQADVIYLRLLVVSHPTRVRGLKRPVGCIALAN